MFLFFLTRKPEYYVHTVAGNKVTPFCVHQGHTVGERWDPVVSLDGVNFGVCSYILIKIWLVLLLTLFIKLIENLGP